MDNIGCAMEWIREIFDDLNEVTIKDCNRL